MKKAKPIFVFLSAAVLIAVLAIAVLAILFRSTEANAATVYSRIDNDLVQEITPHGGMNYRYTLQVYSEDGTASTLDLDTSRILKDGAYILIKTAPLRGVLSWEEMQYNELPSLVQAKYPQ